MLISVCYFPFEAENYMGKASEQAKQALAIFREMRDAEGSEYAKSILDQMYGTSRGGPAAPGQAPSPVWEAAPAVVSSAATAVATGPTRERESGGLERFSSTLAAFRVDFQAVEGFLMVI